MRTCNGSILMLVAAAALLIPGFRAQSQPVTGWSPIPTLDDVHTDLLGVIKRLHLTQAQHAQVDQIIANETMQFALTRENPNLSVAKIIAEQHAIRSQARKQIAAILTPSQKEKVAKWVIHELEERERWGEDPADFFSIPAIY
jgi:hypothetical protein